ncbi:exodeoxyribonuclease VII large subunit [Terricaulis silvestris]|uniref:Exodeoxyribonuclease 7 large subunit n=1 Tax=Terricaulis silvestris TaxID=2686094 RepID=A0A6I6MNH2_9CAUL|nr:exodeoxyribonuclease VII large subunit [Terricaulis silvestris]QGZ94484.1 Exodeoxyribonuclease 7 large subunit [Terricaulis silvestris]
MKLMSETAESTQAANSNLPELTVSELSQAVKRSVETNFDRVRVRGELGRVMIAKSGHLYVDLKDANATISTVMFRLEAQKLNFKPEEGLEVVAEGKLSTFPGRSQYQLICDRMAPAGAGALLAQLEKLKARLQAEGLFARERKKPIPYLPQTIGVVTSPTGAVIRDILHRLRERFPRRVIIWPVLVQGPEAAGQVARAIKGFNALQGRDRPDVLIVARGGGSIEDLWAFNEEAVVRAAAESQIPLISAVGHETDTTLIDYASDLRAPTPTAAAERAVPVRSELIERVTSADGRLKNGLVRGLERRRTELRAAAGKLPRLETLFQIPQQRFDRAAERLNAALVANTRAAQSKLDRVAARLRPEALVQDIARRHDHLVRTTARLQPAIKRTLEGHRKHLDGATRMLESLSHKSVLARGFVMVHRDDGTLVRAAKDLNAGDVIDLTFADDHKKAVIDPPADGAAKPKGKSTKPGGDQGQLF